VLILFAILYGTTDAEAIRDTGVDPVVRTLRGLRV
jgi:hypothetical protein